MLQRTSRLTLTALAVLSVLSFSGCGSSSDSDATSETTTVSGSAVAGPVTGTVTLSDGTGKTLASGEVTDGKFSLAIPDTALKGELDFEVIGTYTDEVSSGTVNLTTSNPLALRLAAGALSAGKSATVGITPETTVIRQMVAEQAKTLIQARNAYQAAFGNTPNEMVRPFDPTKAAPTDATDGDKEASFRVGAYSRFAYDLGLRGDGIAALPTQLAADLADGFLDGHDSASNAVTINAVNGVDLSALHAQSPLLARYLTAMATFAGDTAVNVAGLAAPATGLPSNDGITDFMSQILAAERIVKLADESQIRVYVTVVKNSPFSGMPNTARTVHRVRLTDAATGAPVDVTAGGSVTGIKASATMHMLSGKHHTTPMTVDYDPATSDPANGFYEFSVYYVMASAMKVGETMVPMGIWDLKFTLTNGDATPFAMVHPNVTMAMGALLSSKPIDALDLVPDPTNPLLTVGRSYWIWLNEIAANGGNHDVELFVTTKVGMTFPAVVAGAAYTSGMAPNIDTLTIDTVAVEASATGADGTWQPLTGANGRYSITGLTGLTTGAAGDLYVRLTVNGNPILLPAGNPKLTFTAP